MADWQSYMSDTHVASPSDAHVHPSGNVTSETSETSGIPPWLMEHFRREAAKKREVREAAERAAFTMGSPEVRRAADKLLRESGARLKWARGGSQIVSPRDPSEE